MRLVLPIVTFPVGAFAEAVGAYRELMKLWGSKPVDNLHRLKFCLLLGVVLINSILGPTMAYPALLKKGVPVLLGKEGSKATPNKNKSA